MRRILTVVVVLSAAWLLTADSASAGWRRWARQCCYEPCCVKTCTTSCNPCNTCTVRPVYYRTACWQPVTCCRPVSCCQPSVQHKGGHQQKPATPAEVLKTPPQPVTAQ